MTNQQVALVPSQGRRFRRAIRQGHLDNEGRVVFEGVSAGTYDVKLPDLQPPLLGPDKNPFTPSPRVTILDNGETVRAAIELWRGIPLSASIDVPGASGQGFRARFRHLDTGSTRFLSFPPEGQIRTHLVPGIWQVDVRPRDGFLLIGTELDGTALPGASVTVDLLSHPVEHQATFSYLSPCTISGAVTEISGQVPAVYVEATLVEPGPWIDAARRRGGSRYESVIAPVDSRTSRYEMTLPDGRWQVAPKGKRLRESRPERVEVAMAPGGSENVDFTIELEPPAAETGEMVVIVEGPKGRGKPGAKVEVRTSRDAPPVAAGTSHASGLARVPAPAEGSYLLVAAHVSTLEGTTRIEDYDPDAENPAVPTVRLPRGAEIQVQALDREARPLPGVELRVRRLDPEPEILSEDRRILRSKMSRALVTDHSGRATDAGFYPGRYRLEARLQGADGQGYSVILRSAERSGRRLDLRLGSESVRVDARLVPAPRLRMALDCVDGWPLPQTADVYLMDIGTGTDVAEDGPTARAGDSLSADRQLLAGERRDQLTLGPLVPGLYHLRVRPEGFDRWTWAYGTYDIADAFAIRVGPDREDLLDLGTLPVECGPAVDLIPSIDTGHPSPDVGKVGISVRALELSGEPTEPPRVLRDVQRFELRGLGRGEQILEVTLDHPCFLPETPLTWDLPLDLERGAFQELMLAVPDLGAAIEVRGRSAWARLIATGPPIPDQELETRSAPLKSGRALFPSLPAGTYRVDLCPTADCGSPDLTWAEVKTDPGQVLQLRDRRLDDVGDDGATSATSGPNR
ncbi:MAG: hypothetical protein AAGN66_03430 [Acidobacteriota bacterium]